MIDYEGITTELVSVLSKGLPDVRVLNESPVVGESAQPEIGVYLSGERNTERQISSSNPYAVVLVYRLLVSAYSPNGVSESIAKRGALVNRTRQVLHGNRDLNGVVLQTRMGNVDYDTGQGRAAFYAAANMELLVQIQA